MRHATARLLILLLLAGLFLRPVTAGSQPPSPATLELMKRAKRLQRQMLLEEGREKLTRVREQAREAKKKRRPGAGLRQRRERRADEERYDAPALRALAERIRVERAASPLGPQAVAPNRIVNNPDPTGSNQAQSEVSIAAWGNDVLAVWNDYISSTSQRMGYGYSTNGAQSFVDGGEIPAAAGALWTSDPVVTVNEKTGEFWFCGLLDPTSTTNGVAVARATFSGSTLVWDPVQVAVSLPKSSNFIDKPWATVDSLNGNLYIIYTDFQPTSNQIRFRRSVDSGMTWGPVVTMNQPPTNGYVQGPRVVTGPNGEVYAIWKEIGRVDVDYFRVRRSTDGGQTFDPEVTVAAIYDNFGTGGAGFNRVRGIAFPGIAVDRSNGPNRGRIYVTWNESLNWYEDLANTGVLGSLSESEGNNTPAAANPFTIGQRIVGAFNNSTDVDLFRFNASRGTSYVFYADDLGNTTYSMRVLCTDGSTRLTLTGDDETPGGFPSFTVWTCPEDGTYYLRMFYINLAGSTPSGYTVRTGVADQDGERGRDQRDVFSAYSSNGGSWSAPVRMNDDPPWYDNWLPEIAVAGNGDAWSMWYDFHDSAPALCGGSAHTYLAKAAGSGQSWTVLGPASDTPTTWSVVNSNIIPNMGDYNALFANGAALYPAWGDGRNGNPDVFTAPYLFSLIPITVQSVEIDTAHVAITWNEAAPGSVTATVYRRVGTGADVPLGTITSDGSGTLFFDDLTVTKGTLYHYRLGIDESGTERFGGDVNALVPAGAPPPGLALRGARPNPSPQQIVVALTLASSAPARLSLHDIAGREIDSMELNASTPGERVVTFSVKRPLRPGVYLLRLEQDGQQRSARVSIVP